MQAVEQRWFGSVCQVFKCSNVSLDGICNEERAVVEVGCKRNINITTNTTYFVIKKPTSGSVKASKTLPAKMMDDALMGEIPHT